MITPRRAHEVLDGKLGKSSTVAAVVEEGERVVVLCVVDWYGEEWARIAVRGGGRGSDRVSSGQEQISEQIGVCV